MPQIIYDLYTTPPADDPCYAVYCWNGEHTARKIFKNYGTDRKQAELDCAALRTHAIDAELVAVGAE